MLSPFPWTGGTVIRTSNRTLRLTGPRPSEHGWHLFDVKGRKDTSWAGPAEGDPADHFPKGVKFFKGYVADGWFVRDDVKGLFKPERLGEVASRIFLLERGLDRFSRVRAGMWEDGRIVYVGFDFPQDSEDAVRRAYLAGAASLDGIANVGASLMMSFRVASYLRDKEIEAARAAQEAEEQRVREETLKELRSKLDTTEGRRALAAIDFDRAAQAALDVTGSVLISSRDSYNVGEKVVRFSCRAGSFECVVDKHTFRVVDAGICLTDHQTGRKDDTLFTLESLPSVVLEAQDRRLLHRYRHVDDDDYDDGDDEW